MRKDVLPWKLHWTGAGGVGGVEVGVDVGVGGVGGVDVVDVGVVGLVEGRVTFVKLSQPTTRPPHAQPVN